MPRPVEGQARYMPGLDGLRALAVLSVIFYHLQLPFAAGGLLGVNVFFVLSGYLITDLLLAQYDKRGSIDLGHFWIRRARRLLPALWALLLIVMTWIIAFDPGTITAIRQDVLAAFFYVSNWWYIYHHVSYFARFGPSSPLTHLWSLAVEEQFYLLWPLILVALLRYISKVSYRLIIVGVLILSSCALMAWLYHAGTNPNRVYYGTDTRAFSLLIGAMLAFIWPSYRLPSLSPSRKAVLDGLGILGLLAFFGMVVLTNEYQPFLYRGGMMMLSVMTAFLVAALAYPTSLLGRVLGSKPLKWLGVRSYGIYLWHYPIIVLTTPLGAPPNVLRSSLQVLASLVIAGLSWRFLESPIRQGKWDHVWGNIFHPARWKTLSLTARGLSLFVVILVSLDATGMFGLLTPVTAMTVEPVTRVQVLSTPSATPVSSPSGPAPAPPSEQTHHTPSKPVLSSHSPKTPSSSSPAPVPSSQNPSPTKAPPNRQPGQGVTAIGDSIMIDATPYLRQQLPGIVITGQVGRQFIQAPQVISQLRQEHLLGHYVIIELGTNGPFTLQQLDQLIISLGNRQVIFVNTRVPRPWQNIVNSTLAQGAQQYPNRVSIVNWYQASAGKTSYFYPDGVHLNPQGAAFFASLIAQVVKHVEEIHPGTG